MVAPDIVFDIGANTGQYAAECRSRGYRGRIVSVEPLPVAHSELLRHAEDDPTWTVADRCAVGDVEGVATIHVASNSVSSSIRDMATDHVNAAPASYYVDTEEVPVKRLDSLFDIYYPTGNRAYVKIDTQGFERNVLDGIGRYLAAVSAVEIEVSHSELYIGQELFGYFDKWFADRGFVLWDIRPMFRDPKSGRLLQSDALFVRRENAG